MKLALTAVTVALALGLASPDSVAAKRFGGGGNLGKQRPAPTSSPAAKPAPAAPVAPSSAATPAPPQPGFMQRWGGMLTGLGIGVLLASVFGAQIGPVVGLLLLAVLIAAAAAVIFRLLASRRSPVVRLASFAMPSVGPLQSSSHPVVTPMLAVAARATPAAGGLSCAEVAPFLRVAKSSFIRLQAANDARDLDGIRNYTTAEIYAEIAMQMQERGETRQKTEVVMLDAQLVENAIEGDYALASVRFSGLIRENDANHPAPFEEIWNVRKSLRERNGPWIIAGIQQAA